MTGNENGLPSFQNYRGDGVENNRITRRHQAIIPSYKFVCDEMCGNITEWGVDVHPGGSNHDEEYTLDLQVWRPSPTVDDSTGSGQYRLVGNNRFTSIPLDDDQVARLTPSPQDYIQFQPGDVLGFYVDSDRSEGMPDNDGVVVVISPSSFTSEVVWFASITPTLATSQTTYSIGSSGNLNSSTRAAPVISIGTVTFSCPGPSVTTTLPTPPPQPTTDSNETPPPTTQEPQQPTVPQETTNSPNNDNGQTQTLSNSEVVNTTGVVSSVPTTSEAVSDQQISSGPNIGLVVGVVLASLLAILLALALFAVAAVSLTKRRKTENCFSSLKSRAISNVAYGTKDSSLKMEDNGEYDYVVDGRGSLPVNSSSMTAPDGPMYHETDPYHFLGPDVSKKGTSSTVNKQAPPQSVVNEPTPAVYEVPDTHNLTGTSSYHESPQAQDVFDVVGYHVPTTDERATWDVNHYEMDAKTVCAAFKADD